MAGKSGLAVMSKHSRFFILETYRMKLWMESKNLRYLHKNNLIVELDKGIYERA